MLKKGKYRLFYVGKSKETEVKYTYNRQQNSWEGKREDLNEVI